MTTHPNNNRYVFDFSQEENGWGSTMDSTMDQLDVDVPQVGPLADQPDPTAEQCPNFWYAIDDRGGTLYRREGTSWDEHSNQMQHELPIVATGWSDFKTKVEDASEGAYVWLPPSTANEFGSVAATSTITVPSYVTADATAVQIVPDTVGQDCFDLNSFADLRVRGATNSSLGEYSGSFIRVTGEGQAAKSLFDSTRITADLRGESMHDKTDDSNRESWGEGIHLDATAENGNITGIDVRAFIVGFTDAIKLTAGNNTDSWINGNRFRGRAGRSHRFIHTETTGDGACSANWFNMDLQPTRTPVGGTESFVTFGGRNNVYRGNIFDRREVGNVIADMPGSMNRVETYNIASNLDLVTGGSDNIVYDIRTDETFRPSPERKRIAPTLHDTGVVTIGASSNADVAFSNNSNAAPNVFSGRAAPVSPPSGSVFLSSVDARIFWSGSDYQLRIDNPHSSQLDYRWSVYVA